LYNLSRAARLHWCIKQEAIATIYKGAILPLLSYGAPVWFDAMKHGHNRQKYVRVQRLINLRMARAYRTTSSEALCILTGMTPIITKLSEAVKQYSYREKQHNQDINIDYDVEYRLWPHRARTPTITETESHEEATICAYNDGSKNHRGVGSGEVIFKGRDEIARHKLKLSNNCSNNQAEQLAIKKALEEIEVLNRESINPPTAIIYTDSRVALDSIGNPNNHSFLIEETRKKAASLEKSEWRIKFSWVKAHAGILGNEVADKLAKKAAWSENMQYVFDRIPKSTLQYKAEEEAKEEWQTEWSTSHKAAATRQYFPTVQDRLRLKLKLTPKITAVLTEHGMTKAYLHRFHLREDAKCTCGKDYQSMDHILFHCDNTREQRETMIRHIGEWPTSKKKPDQQAPEELLLVYRIKRLRRYATVCSISYEQYQL